MAKWKKAVPIIVISVVAIFFLTIIVMKEPLKENLYETPSGLTLPGSIGTQVGPGQGSLYFEINGGKTQVEAVSVLNKIPKKGESMFATVCLGTEISGEVQNIAAIHQNRAVITILTSKGLVTVGIKVVS